MGMFTAVAARDSTSLALSTELFAFVAAPSGSTPGLAAFVASICFGANTLSVLLPLMLHGFDYVRELEQCVRKRKRNQSYSTIGGFQTKKCFDEQGEPSSSAARTHTSSSSQIGQRILATFSGFAKVAEVAMYWSVLGRSNGELDGEEATRQIL